MGRGRGGGKRRLIDYEEDNDYDEEDPSFLFKGTLSMTFSLRRPHHLRSSQPPLNPISSEFVNGLIYS